MKVVIYVRVSTQEQAREGYSIGEQIERLTKYCEAMQWEIVETFIDPGYSGGDTERPGLKAMISKIEAGGVEKVVVYKLDRLSRSQKDTLFLIEDVFLKHGTDFVSMNENFDTSTPFGRAMIGILAVFAQLEREQIRERMSMGKEARAKEGKWNGGNTVPVGYDYDFAADKFVINEYEAMQIRELDRLYLAGTPLRSIEEIFLEKGYRHKKGVWDAKMMRRVMRSKIYCGYNKYKGKYFKAEHEAIRSEETWKKINKMLDRKAEQFKLTGVRPGVITTYFGGLLYCKHCGGKFAKDRQNYRNGKDPAFMYICNSRSKRVKKMIKDPNCKNKRWRMNELDGILLAEIRNLATDPDRVAEIQKAKPKTDEPNKVEIIQKEIEKLDAQISRFMDLYGEGLFTIDQVKGKVDPLNETRKGLLREIDQLNAEAGKLSPEEMAEIVESIPDVLDHGDFDEIRNLIETLIYYIEIDNDDIFIHWKFA